MFFNSIFLNLMVTTFQSGNDTNCVKNTFYYGVPQEVAAPTTPDIVAPVTIGVPAVQNI